MIEHCRKLASDRPLHIDCAAAEQHAIRDITGKRRVPPARFVPRRYHIGVPRKKEMRAGRADAGVEVFYVVGARLRENDAMDRKSGADQDFFEKR